MNPYLEYDEQEGSNGIGCKTWTIAVQIDTRIKAKENRSYSELFAHLVTTSEDV